VSLLRRIKESLKYRLFYGYCRTLEKVKKRRLPALDWPEKARGDLPPLLIVTSEKDISLLLYSLHSLRAAATTVPELWLVGDSDEATARLRTVFSAAPRASSVFHWRQFFDELQSMERRFVETWADSKPWGGYAKKYATTVVANRKSAVLLSDADVLWKRDFFPRLQHLLRSNPPVLAGRDRAYSYDRDVAGALHADLFAAPPLNCGFMYYARGVVGRSMTGADYGLVHGYAAHASTHLEQTLIACIFQKAGGQFFGIEEVTTTLEDNFCMKEKVRADVRHYAGAKHLFWRDA
jgi:hypothetical protein